SVASDPLIVDSYKFDDVAAQIFPQSSFLSLDRNSFVSRSQPPFLNNQSFVSFSSQTTMERLASEESNVSSLSSSGQGSQSRILRRLSEQNAQGNRAKIPKVGEVTSNDGDIALKTEIPRTTRQQPQRNATFCTLCNN